MMPKGNRVVALIPARSGSKRLPNKNLLLLAGKPLIAWTIEAALNSPEIDEVVVSTDSINIKKIAIEFGATVPFMRPEILAHDNASTDDVLMHAINELKLKLDDIIVLLQPTSPLRDHEEIEAALSNLKEESVQGVVSVCECEHSPMWANTLPDNRRMGSFIKPEVATKRSQDLSCYYRLNGAIYAYKVSYLEKYRSRFYSDEVKASVMPIYKSVDIDSQNDFRYAEFLILKDAKFKDRF